ncbi:MAG: iron ABC transporter permease, partial [Treponemataceae bacterium]|nr:iron ABC transporter permease [Treponemataceae bacterium]
ARVIVGNEMRHLLPASVLLGAALVLLCDVISRVLFAPFEVPVGIVLSLIGGPFFVVLLLKERRARHD